MYQWSYYYICSPKVFEFSLCTRGDEVRRGRVRGTGFAFDSKDKTSRFFMLRRAGVGNSTCVLMISSRRSSTRYLVLERIRRSGSTRGACRVIRSSARLVTISGMFRRLLRSISVRVWLRREGAGMERATSEGAFLAFTRISREDLRFFLR